VPNEADALQSNLAQQSPEVGRRVPEHERTASRGAEPRKVDEMELQAF
jgi:hypothetical protein